MTKAKHIFIVGIKGTAMAQIAVILKKMGRSVTGSDVKEAFITDPLLKKNGISFHTGFEPSELPKNTDLVIYSAAHGGKKNPQILEALKRNIPVQSQAYFLGQLLDGFKKTIAICGCHGKTTTTSLVAHSLIRMGLQPSYLVGTSSFGEYDGGDFQKDEFFVIEADEYGVNPPEDKTPKFHFLHPKYILCTNIDFDHPDVYKDLEQTKDEFVTFFKTSQLILNADDKNLASVFPRLQAGYVTYGQGADATLRFDNIQVKNNRTYFDVYYMKKPLGTFSTGLAGKKNVSNTAGVILLLLILGMDPVSIDKAVFDFSGSTRRFEIMAELNDITLLDDYGHHPHEIDATIEAARSRYPDRRLIIIFQPHTFSRTFNLKNSFASSLSKADLAILLPIFPSARERSSDFPITSEDIVSEAKKMGYDHITSVSSKQSLLLRLDSMIRPKDVIFTMGAGDVYKLKNDIITIIKKHGHKGPN